jgi:hypothetical protein
MSETTCHIVRDQGVDKTCSVTDFIRQQVQANPPVLAWAEPEITAVDMDSQTGGRREDFTPFVRGVPENWPGTLPLVEARLFWDTAVLHVVSRDDGGCQWARIEESRGNTVERREVPVMTLRDVKRFGLELQPVSGALVVVEYREHGRLVGWRLVVSKG